MGKKTSKKNTVSAAKNQISISSKRKWYQKTGGIIFWLIFFFPVGLYLMWKYSNWNKIIKSIISFCLIFCFAACSLSSKNIEDITLSADTGYNYNIYSEVPIEVETKPSGRSIPESAFSVSGGELEISNDSVVFVAQSPGAYELFVEYEGVKSNTLVINSNFPHHFGVLNLEKSIL